jgi:hypothetical protein
LISDPFKFFNFIGLKPDVLMEENFKCSDCSHQFYIPRYSFQIVFKKSVYIIPPANLPVKCPACNSEQVETVRRSGDLQTVLYGKFSSASEEDKKIMLRKRAEAHNKKTEEQYRTIDKEYRGRVNEKHY